MGGTIVSSEKMDFREKSHYCKVIRDVFGVPVRSYEGRLSGSLVEVHSSGELGVVLDSFDNNLREALFSGPRETRLKAVKELGLESYISEDVL